MLERYGRGATQADGIRRRAPMAMPLFCPQHHIPAAPMTTLYLPPLAVARTGAAARWLVSLRRRMPLFSALRHLSIYRRWSPRSPLQKCHSRYSRDAPRMQIGAIISAMSSACRPGRSMPKNFPSAHTAVEITRQRRAGDGLYSARLIAVAAATTTDWDAEIDCSSRLRRGFAAIIAIMSARFCRHHA